MPRSIDTESNDANMRQQTFSNDKHELTNSEACSILNQRLPNSLHHDNALLSNLFINGTHLRTEPCGSAWHSRHERTTRHIPAPEDCSARKRRQFTRTWRDAQSPKGGTVGKPTFCLLLSPPCEKHTHSAQEPPAYKRKATPTTSTVNIRFVSSTHHVPKTLEQSTCAL